MIQPSHAMTPIETSIEVINWPKTLIDPNEILYEAKSNSLCSKQLIEQKTCFELLVGWQKDWNEVPTILITNPWSKKSRS